MGDITDKHLEWLEGLGVNTKVASAPPTAKPAVPSPYAGTDEYEFSPLKPKAFDPLKPIDPATMDKILREGAVAQKKEAEERLAKVNSALAAVQKYIAEMPAEALSRSGYVQIMKEVRERYPELAGLPQWVKNTAANVQGLKLPRPQALMDVVDKGVRDRLANVTWGMSSNKDPASVNTDRLLAAYMTELPSGVTIDITGGGIVQLGFKGAALKVPIPGGEVDASADKGGSKIALKDYDVTIQVNNDGWEEFDPKLRSEWKKISDEATTLVTLKADKDQVKVELDRSKKKGDEKTTADLTVKFDKAEAEFNLAWTRLQEQIKVTAKASEDKISASVAYLKKDAQDKESVKAGLDAELDLKKMQAKLTAYYASPTLKAALEVTAAADKVAAKLELTAVKSGVVVTANFEKALDEIKAGISIALNDGKTTLAAEMQKKADDISAKLKIVQQTKDLKLAAEIETSLKGVRAAVELEYKPKGGNTSVTVGGNVDGKGKAGGKVQVDIALAKGTSLLSQNDKISISVDVNNQEYKVGLSFSMGEPVATESIDSLFKTVDQQVKELYKLAGDKGVRSIEDVNALNKKLQDTMKPVKDALDKAQTLTKKSEISAKFGFEIAGDWPKGGRAPAMSGSFTATINF